MVGETLAVFLEIDCGGRRGGVLPEGPELMALGQAVQASPSLSLAGVLTHAGQSYDATTAEAIRDVAEDERAAVTLAASRLRAAGIEVPVVSAGSTPTAIHAASMSGVTEIRPGVYTLFDLAQVALRSCTVEDVAVSVLATVIGHNPRAERVLIDAGALALSKDLSGNKRGATVGYGLVCGASGDRPADRLHVADVHQEHGLVAGPRPHEELVEAYPVGARVRILPNHACLTAAPHDRYYVVRGRDTSILDVWPKASGWSGDPPA
jgi:D-serine deaminase-like pyridoxal phosphate-dependent protein